MVCVALYVGGASPVSQSFFVFSGFAVYFYLIFFFFLCSYAATLDSFSSFCFILHFKFFILYIVIIFFILYSPSSQIVHFSTHPTPCGFSFQTKQKLNVIILMPQFVFITVIKHHDQIQLR